MKKLEQTKTETVYMGFTVSGTIITGDWEGDPNVPGGVNYFNAYVDDLSVKLEDEELCGVDILTAKFEDRCADALLEDYRE